MVVSAGEVGGDEDLNRHEFAIRDMLEFTDRSVAENLFNAD